MTTRRFTNAGVIGTSLLALLVYVLTLAPDLTWENFGGDGGELITAAYTWGVPHPPGYPTYVVLGKLFSVLPIGTIAYRFNLFSAVCMAIASGFVAGTAVSLAPFSRNSTQINTDERRSKSGQLCVHLCPPISVGLTFAFAPLVWSQATITEVYGLNLAVLAALVWALVAKRPSWLIGLLFGLSLTTHPTSIFFAPLVFLSISKSESTGKTQFLTQIDTSYSTTETEFLTSNDLFSVESKSRWQQFVAGFLLGLTPYLLIFIFARSGSPVVWGNAGTVAGWWWLISGKAYRGYAFGLPPEMMGPRLLSWGWALLNQFTLLGLPLVLVGGYQFVKQKRHIRLVVGGGITAVIIIIYAVTYRPEDAIIFMLPAILLLALSLYPVLRSLEKVALLLPLSILLLNFSSLNLQQSDLRSRVFETINTLPAQAIVITPGDTTIFTLWYFQQIERIGTDLVLVDSDLFAFDWYRQQLKRDYPHLNALERDNLVAFETANSQLRTICRVSLAPPTLIKSANSCQIKQTTP